MYQTGYIDACIGARRCRRRCTKNHDDVEVQKARQSRANAQTGRDRRDVRDRGEPDPANVYPEHEDDRDNSGTKMLSSMLSSNRDEIL